MVLTDKEKKIANDIATDIVNECEERSKEDPTILSTRCMSDYVTGAKIFVRGLSDKKLKELAHQIDLDVGRLIKPR